MSTEKTAAVLVVGDEILSGRTKDTNSNTIACFLAPFGMVLKEIRVVGDEAAHIIDGLNALRTTYDFVFTTGGIGPTHDDITADCVAAAFGVKIDVRQDAVDMMLQRYRSEDLNEARLRMARIPAGASLIKNPVSFAPGFQIENVFVMAGVPNIMAAMLEDVALRLPQGEILISKTLRVEKLREGEIAKSLGEIAKQFQTLSFGSYPWFSAEGYGVQLVVRGHDKALIAKAIDELLAMIAPYNLTPILLD